MKKGVLRNFAKFSGKDLARVTFYPKGKNVSHTHKDLYC